MLNLRTKYSQVATTESKMISYNQSLQAVMIRALSISETANNLAI